MLYEKVMKIQGENKHRNKACVFHIEEIYDHDNSSHLPKLLRHFNSYNLNYMNLSNSLYLHIMRKD